MQEIVDILENRTYGGIVKYVGLQMIAMKMLTRAHGEVNFINNNSIVAT